MGLTALCRAVVDRFRDHNRAGERINGISREAVVGHSVREVFPGVEAMGLLEVLQRVWRSGNPEHHPVSQYRDERLLLWMENYVFRLPGGEVVTIYRDISARMDSERRLRESEARFRQILKFDPNAIAVYDRDLHYIIASDRYIQDYGVADANIEGKHHYEVFPEVPQRWRDVHRRVLNGAIEKSDRDSFERPDGSITYNKWECRPWFDTDGNIGGMVTYTEVITERVLAEQEILQLNMNLEQRVTDRTAELAAANDRLQELDRLKSMFIASMSHELRTPLNSIIGFAGLLQMDQTGPITRGQRNLLQRVETSGLHLLELISDVIDVSKIEAGKIDIYIEPVCLPDLVLEAVNSVETNAGRKGITVRCDIPEIRLKTDRKRLLQCLLNFLSNAVKYSNHGEIRISAEDDARQVIIKVKDQGVGISKEDLPLLFRQFSRIDSPLTRATSGTGLGLYLTRKLALEALDGNVGVDSTPGAGSTFWISIPSEPTHETRLGD